MSVGRVNNIINYITQLKKQTMKTEETKRDVIAVDYISPSIEVIELDTEKNFADFTASGSPTDMTSTDWGY
jgi:hypothetical protein